jgi:hypothetical protein
MKSFSDMKNAENKKSMIQQTILPLRIEAAKAWKKMSDYLLKTLSTTGTMGTLANLEQHNLNKLNMLTRHDSIIKSYLDGKLPEEATLPENYLGSCRIIAPARQSLLEQNEDFKLKIRILSQKSLTKVQLFWKTLEKESYNKQKFQHINRGVYKIKLEPGDFSQKDFEYYIKAVDNSGKEKYFPTTARELNQTVVIR